MGRRHDDINDDNWEVPKRRSSSRSSKRSSNEKKDYLDDYSDLDEVSPSKNKTKSGKSKKKAYDSDEGYDDNDEHGRSHHRHGGKRNNKVGVGPGNKNNEASNNWYAKEKRKRKRKGGKTSSTDPDFPVLNEERSCRDIFWLVLYILFWGGLLFALYLGIDKGNPRRILFGADSFGNICGHKNTLPDGRVLDLTDRTAVFFFDVSNPKAIELCIPSCPTTTKNVTLRVAQSLGLCVYGFDYLNAATLDFQDFQDNVAGPCPTSIRVSTNVVNRCIERNATRRELSLELLNVDRGWVQEALSDLIDQWRWIMGCCGIAVLFSVIWLLLMRFISGIMVWGCLILATLISLAIAIVSWLKFADVVDLLSKVSSLASTMIDKWTWLAVGIVSTVVFLVLVILMIVLRKSIKLTISIIKEASKSLGNMWTVFFGPIWHAVIVLFVGAYFLGVLLLLVSSGEVDNQRLQHPPCTNSWLSTNSGPGAKINLDKANDSPCYADSDPMLSYNWCLSSKCGSCCSFSGTACNPNENLFVSIQNCSSARRRRDNIYGLSTLEPSNHHVERRVIIGSTVFNLNLVSFEAKFSWNYTTIGMGAYHLFGFIWTMFLIQAILDYTYAGGVSAWYWTVDKGNGMPAHPLLSSLQCALRYNMGSLCFGSFLITLFRLIRVILEIVQRNVGNGESLISKFFMCCCWCLLSLLEAILKFITSNSYIVMSIYGHSFCDGAKRALDLLLKHCAVVLVLNSAGDFVLLLMKLGIAGGNAVISWAVMKDDKDLSMLFIPVGCVFILSFVIASIFVGMLEIAIDTIMINFCLDMEINDGSDDRPYLMSNDLRRQVNSINKSNKKTKKRDKKHSKRHHNEHDDDDDSLNGSDEDGHHSSRSKKKKLGTRSSSRSSMGKRKPPKESDNDDW